MGKIVDVPAMGRAAKAKRAHDRNEFLRLWFIDNQLPTPRTLEEWRGLVGHLQATLKGRQQALFFSRQRRKWHDGDCAKFATAYCVRRSYLDFLKRVAQSA
jgi:hypothetical protein